MKRPTLMMAVLAALLPSLASAAALSAPLDPPPVLSPAGRAWMQSYEALDEPDFLVCMKELRVKPGSILCLHSPPALRADDEPKWMAGKVAPLDSLPYAEALKVARYFLSQENKLNYGLGLWDRTRLFAQTGNENAEPPSQPAYHHEGANSLVTLAESLGGIAIPAAVLALIVRSGRRRRSSVNASASGYVPPVKWRFRYRAEALQMADAASAGSGEVPYDLTSPELLDERSKMLPFVLWYRLAELDQITGPPEGQWVSVIDGNPSLKQPGAPMATYLQTLEVKGSLNFISKQRLRLWSVDPDIIANLNRGPLRQERIEAKSHPSGDGVSFVLPMGAAGAPMPLPPRIPGKTHGTSGVGDGSIDAEPA